MQGLRTAWKEAAWVFGLSRLVILIATYIGAVMVPVVDGTPPNCMQVAKSCLFVWYRWDAKAYVRIASQGYSFTPDVGFFPLWPFLMHLGGLVLGGRFPLSYYLAGLLLANLFFYFALVLLYHLLVEDFEPTIARRTLFYLALYPYALFFFAGYTESLFVLLCVAIFLLLRRGHPLDWWLAGLLGLLAVFTRSSAVALAVPFLVVYIQRFWLASERTSRHTWLQKLNALAPVALIPAGILAYILYLGITKGNPFIISVQEASYWHRHFAFPWEGYGPAFGALFTQSIFSQTFLQNLGDIVFSLIPVAVLVFGWKLIPLHYRLFSVALVLFALCFPLARDETLASQPRYMMVIFPIVVIMAYWGKRPWFDRFFVALSVALLALNVVLFITHHPVA